MLTAEEIVLIAAAVEKRLEPRFQALEEKIGAVEQRLDGKINGLDGKINGLADVVEAYAKGTNERLERIERRLDGQPPLELV